MDRFLLIVNLSCLVVQSAAQLCFVCRLTGKHPRAWHFVFSLSALGLAEWMGSRLALSGIFAVGGELLILYAVLRFALRNGRAVSCVSAVLAVYFAQLSFGVVDSLEMLLFPRLVPDAMLRPLILLATLTALALCVLCYAAVLRLSPMADGIQAPLLALLLLPELFFLSAQLYILDTAYQVLSLPLSPQEVKIHAALLILQALGLAAALCTLYAYRRICQGFETQAALASLTQAAEAQQIYLAEAQARYERTRAFRHDLQNHLSVLDGLLRGGRLDEGRAYLQKLRSVSTSLSFPHRTGNPVADILLAEKLETARAEGIAAEVSLTLPSPCGIDDLDLCVILANALDNAIHACKAVERDRRLCIRGERQGDFYLLTFENTCVPGPVPPMGAGLSNIRAVSEKYGGAMATEKKDTVFTLSLLLNIS